MNNVIKPVLEFSESSPFFLLYILAPNKIKRPILRKKGTAHTGPFGLLLSKKYYAFFIFETMQLVLVASY